MIIIVRQHSENVSQTCIWVQLTASNHEILEMSNIYIKVANLADTQILPKSIELNGPFRKCCSYMCPHLYNTRSQTNRQRRSTSRSKVARSWIVMPVFAGPIVLHRYYSSSLSPYGACSTSHYDRHCAPAQENCF